MANTTNFGWETPDDTDLVKDGAAAMRTLGSAIDTSMMDLKGGTTDQVLAKNSNTDMDFKWVTSDDANAIQNAIVDAKGDLITATAADTPARLAVGTNGQVLTADSSTSTGLKWAPSGKVLQVVSATSSTQVSVTTETYTDITGVTASITPSATSSKILVLAMVPGRSDRSSGNGQGFMLRLVRGATEIFGDTNGRGLWAQVGGSTSQVLAGRSVITWLDSPSTTSSTTYKIQGRPETSNNTGTATFNETTSTSSIILMEIGA